MPSQHKYPAISFRPPEDDGGWYLGCFRCRAEINVTDGGMCAGCRDDLEHDAAMYDRDNEAC